MIDFVRVDTSKLSLILLRSLNEAVGQLPDRWVVTEGWRSRERQEQLWKRFLADPEHAPRAAPPGRSPHEWGLAVDVVLDGDPETPKVEPIYNTADPRWLRLFDAIWDHPRLHSGRSFEDADHIELLNFKQYIPKAA